MKNENRLHLKQESDLRELEAYIQKMMGQTCSKARLSYGDELQLHFGIMTPSTRKTLSHIKNGQWMLGARASDWIISSSGKAIVSSKDDLSLVKKKIHCIENSVAISFKIGYPTLDLTIEFSNEIQLHIMPDESHDEFSDLALWELFTLDTMYLGVWKNRTWVYMRAD